MNGLSIRENVSLAPLTTLGVGGPARWFSEIHDDEQLREALRFARTHSLEVFILGGGSNLVISDTGFDGIVLRIVSRGIEQRRRDDGKVEITAAAGEPWDELVRFAVERNLAGMECLSGIPGSTGATPIQNVGAYGQEVAETVTTVDLLDRNSLEAVTFTNADCRFGYRQSIFKSEAKDRYVVTRVRYALVRDGAPSIRYPDLQKYFDEQKTPSPTLAETRAGVIAVRRRKGMVLDPLDPDTRSDGSFFMNPVVPSGDAKMFIARAREIVGTETKIPAFPAGEGKTKLSAAWLIEHAGFSKGFVRGNAGLSSKHALAIINRGNASAEEIVALKEEIQRGVFEKFGVEIHPEPNFIGFRDGL